MKKKGSRSKVSRASARSASVGGYCIFTCNNGTWELTYDGSETGYYCENSLGDCAEEEEGQTVTTDAWPEEGGTEEGGTEEGGTEEGGTEEGGTEEGGTEEGGTEEGGTDDGGGAFASSQATQALPKNTALYRFVRSRKVVRRVRGAWAKGLYTPLELTLKELAKFAPKVYKIVNVMAKNRAVESFQVLIPAQKLPRRKKGTSSGVAKSSPRKAASKVAAKKSNPKTVGRKGATPKKKKKK